MNIKRAFVPLEQTLTTLVKWVTYITALITVFSFLVKVFEWGKSGPLAFLADNILILWLISLTLSTIVLWLWVRSLHQRFTKGFSDNFKGNLAENWDFVGDWRIAEEGTLLVSGSDEGGITKVGALWENYTFSFKARIINQCLGVIVRAQGLNNYYMFQIRPDKIRPHRRIEVPVITDDIPENKDQDKRQKPRPIASYVGWIYDQVSPRFSSVPVHISEHDWFSGQIIVRGQSIRIYINDSLVFQDPSLLEIPYGKVGFRNSHTEQAYVKDVKVILQS